MLTINGKAVEVSVDKVKPTYISPNDDSQPSFSLDPGNSTSQRGSVALLPIIRQFRNRLFTTSDQHCL